MQIDDEFKALIPPLSDEERALLEQSLLNEGCRDALVVWHDTLIDGHNRYELCQKHSVEFKTVERDFRDRNEALAWIIQNQLGRRNIADYTRGRLALRLEDAIAAQAKANQGARTDILPTLVKSSVNTQSEVARVADLSKGTIHKVKTVEESAPAVIKQAAEKEEISINRAYELTKALETAKEANPRFYEETVTRGHILNLDGEDVPLTKADPTLIRVMSSEDDYERVKRWETHKRNGTPKALQMSESNEWYTPPNYITAARELMGAIDLDPASCELANEVVKAERYFTLEDDGFSQVWRGRVWLNPPYGRDGGDSNQALWSARLIKAYCEGDVTEAVLLINAVTDRHWFQPLWDFPICFTDHRIRFYDQNGEAGSPTHGNAFVYLGKQTTRFVELFSPFGVVVQRWAK